jgi:release factor glutamine methyltransferase
MVAPIMESVIIARLRAAGCVFAEDEAALLIEAAASEPDTLERMVAQRVAGLPLEHILGWVDFCGLRLAVGPGVFVPRQRTEFLVRRAVAVTEPGAIVVDMCCGCGALGAALASIVPDVEVYASDIEPAAIKYARTNLGGRVFLGDLFEPLPAELRGRVRTLMANVPYVPTDRIALMPPEAREHEPRSALDGGDDGLAVARRLLASAGEWLEPGGNVLFEASGRQVPAAINAVAAAGLWPRVERDEEMDATVIIGEWRDPA